jgi:hypothetical protein
VGYENDWRCRDLSANATLSASGHHLRAFSAEGLAKGVFPFHWAFLGMSQKAPQDVGILPAAFMVKSNYSPRKIDVSAVVRVSEV